MDSDSVSSHMVQHHCGCQIRAEGFHTSSMLYSYTIGGHMLRAMCGKVGKQTLLLHTHVLIVVSTAVTCFSTQSSVIPQCKPTLSIAIAFT